MWWSLVALAAPVSVDALAPFVPAPSGAPVVAAGDAAMLVLGARNLCGGVLRAADVTRLCAGEVTLRDRPDARAARCGDGWILVGNTSQLTALWLDASGRAVSEPLVVADASARALAVACAGGKATVAWTADPAPMVTTLVRGDAPTAPRALPLALDGRADRIEVAATADGAVVVWEEQSEDGARAIVSAGLTGRKRTRVQVVSGDGFDERAPVVGPGPDGWVVAWAHGDLESEAWVAPLGLDGSPIGVPSLLHAGQPRAVLGGTVWVHVDGDAWVAVGDGAPVAHSLGAAAVPVRVGAETWVVRPQDVGLFVALAGGGPKVALTGHAPSEHTPALGRGGPRPLITWNVGRTGHGGDLLAMGMPDGTPHRLDDARWGTQVAWGGDGWLAVWFEGLRVRLLPLAPDGTPRAPAPVTLAAYPGGERPRPAVAFDGEHFVVVWTASRPRDFRGTVVGTRVDVSGRRVGAPFALAEDAGDPRVACVSAGCVVVYAQELHQGSTRVGGSLGATVVVEGVPGRSWRVAGPEDRPRAPRVAAGTDGLILGWTQGDGEVVLQALDSGAAPTGDRWVGPDGDLRALVAAPDGAWGLVGEEDRSQLVRFSPAGPTLVGPPREARVSDLALVDGEVIVVWGATDPRTGRRTVLWDGHRP